MENEFLKRRNRELEEEVNDLKMLMQVYETNFGNDVLPPLPETLL